MALTEHKPITNQLDLINGLFNIATPYLNTMAPNQKSEEQPTTSHKTTTTQTTVTNAGAPVDPQMQQLIATAMKALDMSKMDINVEKKDIEKRIEQARNQISAAMFLSQGGNESLAANLINTASQELAKLEYLKSQIEANPDGYKLAKALSIIEQGAQGISGLAQAASSKYLPASYAASMAQAAAYRSTSSPYANIPMYSLKDFIDIAQLYLQSGGDKKGKPKLQNAMLNLLNTMLRQQFSIEMKDVMNPKYTQVYTSPTLNRGQ